MSDFEAYIPAQSDDNKLSEDKQRHFEVASLPVIVDVLEWFDTQISELHDPTIITSVNDTTPPEQVKAAVMDAQRLIAAYTKKRNQFKNDFSNYIEEEDLP